MTISTKWLTKKEAAMHLKLSVRSIEKLVKNGLLQAHKIGGRVLLHLDEIDAAVRGHFTTVVSLDNNKRLWAGSWLKRIVSIAAHLLSVANLRSFVMPNAELIFITSKQAIGGTCLNMFWKEHWYISQTNNCLKNYTLEEFALLVANN
jgi:excisionase family DNA binding protein